MTKLIIVVLTAAMCLPSTQACFPLWKPCRSHPVPGPTSSPEAVTLDSEADQDLEPSETRKKTAIRFENPSYSENRYDFYKKSSSGVYVIAKSFTVRAGSSRRVAVPLGVEYFLIVSTRGTPTAPWIEEYTRMFENNCQLGGRYVNRTLQCLVQ
jgi:hypothetical protein